jgi:hypothetical protein
VGVKELVGVKALKSANRSPPSRPAPSRKSASAPADPRSSRGQALPLSGGGEKKAAADTFADDATAMEKETSLGRTNSITVIQLPIPYGEATRR